MGDEHETDRLAPEISWKGRLDQVISGPEVWRGGITAKMQALMSRFNRDAGGVRDVLEELKSRVNEYFVLTDLHAQVRCIDGRVENTQPEPHPSLGPQIAGGTPAASLSYRLAMFDKMPADATINSDLDEVRRIIEALNLPYMPGAHEDEHSAHSDEKTGCGAIDKMLDILEIMGDGETVYEYTKAIAGEHFDEETFQALVANVRQLNQPELRDRYFMRDKQTGRFKYANTLINHARRIGAGHGRKSVEKLTGEHNEVLLVINTVPGTTLNRDQLSVDNHHLAQVFNYDFWFSVERAQAIFAHDEVARKKVIISQAMFAVGTAMALTDGSLEYGVRA